MTADDLTWTKAKNAMVVGAAGVAVLIAGQILSEVSAIRKEVAELKKDVAVYQANEAALERRVSRVEDWEPKHEERDLTVYRKLGVN